MHISVQQGAVGGGGLCVLSKSTGGDLRHRKIQGWQRQQGGRGQPQRRRRQPAGFPLQEGAGGAAAVAAPAAPAQQLLPGRRARRSLVTFRGQGRAAGRRLRQPN
jgi:hypothetical protein